MSSFNITIFSRIARMKASVKNHPLSRYTLIPAYRRVRIGAQYTRNQIRKARLYSACISKKKFISDIKYAIDNNKGFAAGKIGYSEQHWMYYEIILGKSHDKEQVSEFERLLNFHGLQQEGVFPADPEYYLEFNRTYIPHVRNLDIIGICYRPWELEIIKYYQLGNKLIHYLNQEPDRSCPSDDTNCYLQYFRNKRLLLICPFAGVLKERATKDVFEKTWSRTGKKWFDPKEVDALEFPYGFSVETQRKYGQALRLLDDIRDEIDRRTFDVALIGAAGLAIPIASHIKNMGKLGIDLGGHLQVLFGVIGKRWRMRDDWKRYFNEWWIDMPERYKPKEVGVCDGGAYW